MGDVNSLIDLRAVSEPACKLIDAVSGAIGLAFEPTRIRRKATADADAMVTLAGGREKVSEIDLRIEQRVYDQELRRQENIESVTRRAVKELPEEVSNEPVDKDWLFRFFDECKDIGDEEMQSLWARLLAGQVAQPGTFSLRTIATVKTLQKKDADLFTLYCGCVWIDGDRKTSLVFNNNPEVREVLDRAINFGGRMHLNALGLIEHSAVQGFQCDLNEPLLLRYFNRKFVCSPTAKTKVFQHGNSILTDIGQELAMIAGGLEIPGYCEAVVAHLMSSGIDMQEIV